MLHFTNCGLYRESLAAIHAMRTRMVLAVLLHWIAGRDPSVAAALPSSDAFPSSQVNATYALMTNILYLEGTNLAEFAKDRCRLDVYYPVDTTNFPTVVWFHGGGLTGGSRSVPAGLQGKGIAVVAAGYRLSPQVKSPVYIEDAAAAVAWTFRHIAHYGGATNRIFVSGHSAGGYLTGMIGLDKRWLAAHGVDADGIAGLVPYSGHCITHFTIRAERGISDTQPIIDNLAPLFHVRSNAPPLLLITGDRDLEMLGRYEENAYLWRMMKQVGHPDTHLRELKGLDHGKMAEAAHPLLLQFLQSHDRPESVTGRIAAQVTSTSTPATPVRSLLEDEKLRAFLKCQVVPRLGNEWDYIFAPGKLPDLEWDRPELVEQAMGSFPLKIQWYDGDGRRVTSADRSGRYAFYAEGITPCGKTIRRGGTLFCRPKDWDGWSEKPKAYLDFLPMDGLRRRDWTHHQEAIAVYAGRTVLMSILRQQEGAILMSWLHELKSSGTEPSPTDTPMIRDQEFHLALKRKILGIETKSPGLRPPHQISGKSAPIICEGTETEAGFKPGTVSNIREICRVWFERSREPFNLVVARRGMAVLDETFGSYTWGPLTRETPTEMASITKLVTGVLFAQFVDQGLLGIDDPVGKYLPDFPVTGTNVLTLRHCFTHATALEGHEEWGGMHNPWLENVVANAGELLRPGQVHNYNGMGYDLAGRVMEIVSGRNIFRLMRENLFDPLGMSHTTLEEDLGFSCFSTAADFAKLGQMLLNRGAYGELMFFTPQTFEQCLPQPLNRYYPAIQNTDWGIGLTWMRQQHPEAGKNAKAEDTPLLGRNIIGHGSATSAIFRVDLDHEVVIAQTRRRAGADYDQYLTKLLLAIQDGLQ
jgi:CubicO group peptidase (beta-lactamase class C family)/acetyl esterase/lipase